jgi:hypothetical protein
MTGVELPSAQPIRTPPIASASRGALPAVVLMVMAPLLAEVLPGATRLSSIAVFPIEVCVWGGGALLIRYAVRRLRLGWRNMLLLALALSIAEECLIQQTSLAPMVIRLKGREYARALGVNYLYLLWALVYESVFVVFAPICLTELIFRRRRDDPWLGPRSAIVVGTFFAIGCALAWFTWTQIARPKVFHVPPYRPPLTAVAAACAVIAALLFCALGSPRTALSRASKPLRPPAAGLIAFAAGTWAVLWYGLVLLAFGIAPDVPPGLAVAVGIVLALSIVLILPRWAAHPQWNDLTRFAAVSGAICGSMLVSFVGFIGSLPRDLYFKIGVDLLALALLAALGLSLRRQDQIAGSGCSDSLTGNRRRSESGSR